MYKVLDSKGNAITVAKVDVSKHRHRSGREFTKSEFPSTMVKAPITKAVKETIKTEEKKVVTKPKKTIFTKTK